jgi:diacylglycerol kinase
LATPADATPPSTHDEDASAVVARPRHFRRIVRSFGYAVEGLSTMVATQPNFWVHLGAAVVALWLGVALRLTPDELVLIVLTVALVLTVECLNTALETLCDLVSPEFHPLVKRAKDMSAAAVLLGAIGSVAVAVLLFGPRLLGMVK